MTRTPEQPRATGERRAPQQTREPQVDAIVIGAGPAGSSAAAVLAGRGRRVMLLEKDRFPRPKVCGEFLSSTARESLERLGVLERVESEAETIRRGTLHLPGAGAIAFELPRPGLGVSRYLLDDLLAARARELGADLHFGSRVLALDREDSGGFRVRFAVDGAEREAAARAVVGAWGRWDPLDRALDREFSGRGKRYLGWSRDYAPDSSLAGTVRLFAFPGGYCGLSRVEGGIVNLAGVVAEDVRRRLPPGWDAVVAHARAANGDLDADLAPLTPGPVGFLGTGPVYFTAKPPAENGILMAGDAAGVIDPFSGEGQAAALASGILAAETLESAFDAEGAAAPEETARLYAAAWRRRFERRFSWSAALRRLMLHPSLGGLAARVAGPRAVRFAIARLSSRA
ncbi:MAG TPA: NAD(P)/FAD-dependent oxidoreductase [Thermoanaerobaculia bacterium]|jgi:flavin-dependent dehydrogenase